MMDHRLLSHLTICRLAGYWVTLGVYVQSGCQTANTHLTSDVTQGYCPPSHLPRVTNRESYNSGTELAQSGEIRN